MTTDLCDVVYEELVAAIEELPKQQQYVLSMRYEHSMNFSEIAAALEVTEDNVRRLYDQAIHKLMRPINDF